MSITTIRQRIQGIEGATEQVVLEKLAFLEAQQLRYQDYLNNARQTPPTPPKPEPTPPKATPTLPPTPALDHMKAQSEKLHTQAIGDFLEWLGERGIHLARYGRHGDLYPDHSSKNDILAQYAGVDLAACEAERRAILAAIRS